MSLVVHPDVTLFELLQICSDASEDIKENWEALTGAPWEIDGVVAQLFNTPGPKWTVSDGALAIAAGGFVMVRPGVYRDWLAPSSLAFSPKYWRAVTKACKRIMDSMLKGTAHRLECVCLASRAAEVVDWYGVLGYQFEGTLVAAGSDGEDLAAYYRTRTK